MFICVSISKFILLRVKTNTAALAAAALAAANLAAA